MLDHAYDPSTWLPYLAILENLFSSIAWPLAAFAIFFTFRSQLRDLIPKIESISAPGVSIGMAKGQGNTPLGEPPIRPSIERLNPNVLRSAPLAGIEHSLQNDLNAVPVDQREAQLLTSLAQTRLESAFNLAYANIFGSQIRALRLLNDRGGKISRETADFEFKALQKEHQVFSDWSLDQYLNFLRHYLFIDEVQGEFVLTDFGREFLAHLSRKGLSEERLH